MNLETQAHAAARPAQPAFNRWSFGALALPLALVGLPLYVFLPNLFVQQTGLSLALIGTVLLSARLFEAFADPYLGTLIDRLQSGNPMRLKAFSYVAAACLALGVVSLLTASTWLSPAWPAQLKAVSLVILVALVYLMYSWLSITHYTLATCAVARGVDAAPLFTLREGLGLAGVLLGSVLPQVLGWGVFAWVCAVLVAAAMWLLRGHWGLLVGSQKADAPAHLAHPTRPSASETHAHSLNPLRQLDAYSRRVLGVFFLSTFAGSLPASLIGFYVADGLGLGDVAPKYLAVYFAAAALGYAAWPRLAARFGTGRVWAAGMLAIALIFSTAFTLSAATPHVALWFGAVTAASGLLLGAEWALPQTLISSHLAATGQAALAGRVFGLWTWAQKLALALATGVALWGLALLGYVPSASNLSNTPIPNNNITALVWLYCLVPAVLKAITALAAWQFFSAPPQQQAR